MDEELKTYLIPISHKESWEGLGKMMKLGFMGVLTRVMGWWAFDVFTQLASFLSVHQLAGQTILRNIGLFTFMLPVGICTAITVLIGDTIGKN